MTDRVDFSIIIPTYNRPRQLAICLESIGKLDYPRSRFETIVIDDGSTPPVEPTASAFCDRLNLIVCYQKNQGPASARNKGAIKASGRYLAFTDDDCTPAANWLRKLAERFESSPDCIIGGRTINSLEENVYSAASQDLIDYFYQYHNADHRNAIFFASNNLALDENLFRSLGGFDPGFPSAAAEDRDLCDRCRANKHKLIYAPEVVVYHHHFLRISTFWRQHFGYGRGAFHFHRARRRRMNGGFELEKISFYTDLVRYPFLKHKKSTAAALVISALFGLSQTANAAGFIWESLESWKNTRSI